MLWKERRNLLYIFYLGINTTPYGLSPHGFYNIGGGLHENKIQFKLSPPAVDKEKFFFLDLIHFHFMAILDPPEGINHDTGTMNLGRRLHEHNYNHAFSLSQIHSKLH